MPTCSASWCADGAPVFWRRALKFLSAALNRDWCDYSGTQRAQRSKKFEISSEIENFERERHFRASHPPRPYFCGEFDTSRLIFSSEIKNFDRDSNFRWGLNFFGRWALWGELEVTDLRWQREPKTQVFAENRSFSRKFKHLGRAQETAENRRFSQKTADFRRKPQETADWAPSP